MPHGEQCAASLADAGGWRSALPRRRHPPAQAEQAHEVVRVRRSSRAPARTRPAFTRLKTGHPPSIEHGARGVEPLGIRGPRTIDLSRPACAPSVALVEALTTRARHRGGHHSFSGSHPSRAATALQRLQERTVQDRNPGSFADIERLAAAVPLASVADSEQDAQRGRVGTTETAHPERLHGPLTAGSSRPPPRYRALDDDDGPTVAPNVARSSLAVDRGAGATEVAHGISARQMVQHSVHGIVLLIWHGPPRVF